MFIYPKPESNLILHTTFKIVVLAFICCHSLSNTGSGFTAKKLISSYTISVNIH